MIARVTTVTREERVCDCGERVCVDLIVVMRDVI